MANKFKVGDMVIGNNKADKCYDITKKGWIGRVVNKKSWDRKVSIRVEDVNDKNSYAVDPDCFDLYIPHEGNILIMVDEKDHNKVVARDLITKKTAEAKCNPKDEWDFSKGAKLALERLYPEKKEEKKPKYWSGKVVCVESNLDGLFFTKGKVYKIIDGTLMDNFGSDYITRVKSLECLHEIVGNPHFIEFKGEASHA